MFTIFIALTVIGFILVLTDGKNESTRWIGYVIFAAAAASLSILINDTIKPYLAVHHLTHPAFNTVVHFASVSLGFIGPTAIPYCFLIYGLSYSGFFKPKTVRRLKPVLFLPLVVTFLVTPIYPELRFDYVFLSYWVAPYVIVSSGLLIWSYIKEKDATKKRSRLLAAIITITPMLIALSTSILLRAFHIEEAWRFNAIGTTFVFAFFCIVVAKSGILGVKINFEKQRLDSAMKAITSGTGILNHTIKNQIMKISICTDNIQMQSGGNDKETNENLAIIKSATDHLLAMVSRIQDQMQHIVLHQKKTNLGALLDGIINTVEPHYLELAIRIRKRYVSDGLDVLCDPVHIEEVVTNIIKNAVEAMPGGGEIEIFAAKSKKHTTLTIKDNGAGITETNIPYVFDPFFTTKNKSLNFGLGLSYCYNVMNLSGGSLDITSEQDRGTTVRLHFSNRIPA
ncbi:sensor histidine kinase [Paenibacillus sp. GCM10027627]|uniref:sensor histidine kinase n=1 Tax=unclassified Paenibacillus TaxID=185978 RepID=UPI003625AE32